MVTYIYSGDGSLYMAAVLHDTVTVYIKMPKYQCDYSSSKVSNSAAFMTARIAPSGTPAEASSTRKFSDLAETYLKIRSICGLKWLIP